MPVFSFFFYFYLCPPPQCTAVIPRCTNSHQSPTVCGPVLVDRRPFFPSHALLLIVLHLVCLSPLQLVRNSPSTDILFCLFVEYQCKTDLLLLLLLSAGGSRRSIPKGIDCHVPDRWTLQAAASVATDTPPSMQNSRSACLS